MKQHPKRKKSPSHNKKTKKKLPSWYSDSLPKVKRATTRKRSKSSHPKNPFDKPLKAYNKFKKTLNNENNTKTSKISEKLFADTCTGMDTRYNNITFNDSMQRFYSTANTQIPNNQKGFAEWCYGNMPSAKEGDPTALINNAPPHWIGGKQ